MRRKDFGSILSAPLRSSTYHEFLNRWPTSCSSQTFLQSSPVQLTVNRSTPLLQDWLGDDAAKRQRREIHFPTGRFGEAIEQAQAVLFLASDESSFVNGTDFVVDGGMSKVRFHIATTFLLFPVFLACLKYDFEKAEKGKAQYADMELRPGTKGLCYARRPSYGSTPKFCEIRLGAQNLPSPQVSIRLKVSNLPTMKGLAMGSAKI